MLVRCPYNSKRERRNYCIEKTETTWVQFRFRWQQRRAPSLRCFVTNFNSLHVPSSSLPPNFIHAFLHHSLYLCHTRTRLSFHPSPFVLNPPFLCASSLYFGTRLCFPSFYKEVCLPALHLFLSSSHLTLCLSLCFLFHIRLIPLTHSLSLCLFSKYESTLSVWATDYSRATPKNRSIRRNKI